MENRLRGSFFVMRYMDLDTNKSFVEMIRRPTMRYKVFEYAGYICILVSYIIATFAQKAEGIFAVIGLIASLGLLLGSIICYVLYRKYNPNKTTIFKNKAELLILVIPFIIVILVLISLRK